MTICINVFQHELNDGQTGTPEKRTNTKTRQSHFVVNEASMHPKFFVPSYARHHEFPPHDNIDNFSIIIQRQEKISIIKIYFDKSIRL